MNYSALVLLFSICIFHRAVQSNIDPIQNILVVVKYCTNQCEQVEPIKNAICRKECFFHEAAPIANALLQQFCSESCLENSQTIYLSKSTVESCMKTCLATRGPKSRTSESSAFTIKQFIANE
ncbi:hypothetical protein T4B_7018 [Trichinella pseudospiralis]|uniref:Uncharacterized protein n=2 Tax=Trichinella pseudospiralis TaxID=6337 RepID=A0A0V1FZ88_TRIPS|nr:hypothetical protein T4E_10121 [Trichinella pseudospiralis]KRX98801.1 hypothetical protein T4E_8470 [Trichinella pseudospiralis]KRY79137.1 hypothetical protein T4A_10632 [Trichinella pseudospiralis]KRY79220.1 hypothetical protein T4A_3302 [Trichinella pseudospiralis]KRY91306.1 hypothetical protein T4D_1799 [Trichinella pseudospiralis]